MLASSYLILSFFAALILSSDFVPSFVDTEQFSGSRLQNKLPKEAENTFTEHSFTLQYVFHHGIHHSANVHLQRDIPPGSQVWLHSGDERTALDPALTVRGRPTDLHRLVDRRPSVVEPLLIRAREEGRQTILPHSAWSLERIDGPDVTEKSTVINLALMSLDAYIKTPGESGWEDLDLGYNSTLDFGWESNGIRGHVYADETNSTVIIGVKGTSKAVYDSRETETNDKENDNLFFSCCCAEQGQWTWRQVCSCATSAFSCNQTCLIKELRDEHRYYAAIRHLYTNVTAIYPDANIWVTGHSLGGAVSSLLGLTYGLPVVTFEAVPAALPASRLGLPVPPGTVYGRHQSRSMTGIYQFGNTADPVYMGTCTGSTATCSWAGYSFQSQCHVGHRCSYDTVKDLKWRQTIYSHQLDVVVKDVLRAYDKVADCFPEDEDCVDCFNWKFFESNSSEPVTTSVSSSTRTRTRTATCQTPGWWGCRDETATATSTTLPHVTTTSVKTSPTTCRTPGWFWCLDKSTTSDDHTTSCKSWTVPELTPTLVIATSHIDGQGISGLAPGSTPSGTAMSTKRR